MILGAIWKYVSAALGISSIVLALISYGEGREIHHWHTQFDSEHRARLLDRQSYQNAQTAAGAKQDQQIAAVKRQQQEITDATVSRLNSRLQLIGDELRRQNASPQSAPGSAKASDPGDAPCRAIDPAWLCLSPTDRLRAAENEERHDELIDWAIGQSKIDPNKEPPQ